MISTAIFKLYRIFLRSKKKQKLLLFIFISAMLPKVNHLYNSVLLMTYLSWNFIVRKNSSKMKKHLQLFFRIFSWLSLLLEWNIIVITWRIRKDYKNLKFFKLFNFTSFCESMGSNFNPKKSWKNTKFSIVSRSLNSSILRWQTCWFSQLECWVLPQHASQSVSVILSN